MEPNYGELKRKKKRMENSKEKAINRKQVMKTKKKLKYAINEQVI